MPDNVKPRRAYDSRRRQAQAAQTRADVLAAAHEIFLERGYSRATLAAIAESSGVVVETIYRLFGGKAGLFQAVVESAVAAGPARADVAVEERPAIRAVIDETDPVRQLELYAATQPGIHARIGQLMKVLNEAAASDPTLADAAKSMERQRLEGLGRFAQLLADRRALRPGLSVDEARDQLWTLASHAVHNLLVVERGWSPQQYQEWLAATLAKALLP